MATASDNMPLLARLSALNDLGRLRVLRLLEREELSVGELARALQLPQSTVSRHLKLLSDGGWTIRRSEGTASLYRVAESALSREARALWSVAREQLRSIPTFQQDDARLAQVLAERRTDSRAFFGRVGGEWDALRRDLFGEAFTADALLSLVEADWVVADLGCGTGNAAEQLAPLVKKVIAVDREPAMLDAARTRLTGFNNVEFRQGDIERLPLKDREVDAAMMFLVLVHLHEPEQALSEARRAIKPGGILLLVDLAPHDHESYRLTMGHRHLGFDEKPLKAWARAAGFARVRYRRLRPDVSSKGPGLFAATLR